MSSHPTPKRRHLKKSVITRAKANQKKYSGSKTNPSSAKSSKGLAKAPKKRRLSKATVARAKANSRTYQKKVEKADRKVAKRLKRFGTTGPPNAYQLAAWTKAKRAKVKKKCVDKGKVWVKKHTVKGYRVPTREVRGYCRRKPK